MDLNRSIVRAVLPLSAALLAALFIGRLQRSHNGASAAGQCVEVRQPARLTAHEHACANVVGASRCTGHRGCHQERNRYRYGGRRIRHRVLERQARHRDFERCRHRCCGEQRRKDRQQEVVIRGLGSLGTGHRIGPDPSIKVGGADVAKRERRLA